MCTTSCSTHTLVSYHNDYQTFVILCYIYNLHYAILLAKYDLPDYETVNISKNFLNYKFVSRNAMHLLCLNLRIFDLAIVIYLELASRC